MVPIFHELCVTVGSSDRCPPNQSLYYTETIAFNEDIGDQASMCHLAAVSYEVTGVSTSPNLCNGSIGTDHLEVSF